MVLLRSIATVGGMTMISRVFGFLRDILIAGTLGAGPTADAFFVAFRLPNLFRSLFAEGAFTAAFVPIFAGILEGEGKARAAAFAQQAFSVLLWILLAFVVVVEMAMPLAIGVLAHQRVAERPEAQSHVDPALAAERLPIGIEIVFRVLEWGKPVFPKIKVLDRESTIAFNAMVRALRVFAVYLPRPIVQGLISRGVAAFATFAGFVAAGTASTSLDAPARAGACPDGAPPGEGPGRAEGLRAHRMVPDRAGRVSPARRLFRRSARPAACGTSDPGSRGHRRSTLAPHTTRSSKVARVPGTPGDRSACAPGEGTWPRRPPPATAASPPDLATARAIAATSP